jgi:hypothetical protein
MTGQAQILLCGPSGFAECGRHGAAEVEAA